MTVARLVEEMSAEEFDSWMEFYAGEPWGYDIETLRMGILAAEIHNSSGHAKRAAQPRNFFPKVRGREAPKDAAYWQATKDGWRAFIKRQRDGKQHARNRRSRSEGQRDPA